ncbi:hypothetical protein Bca52824_082107 [Brassica carinata]|uniref:Uncharacterized protein n=1 Tax=Brassica carinata TaxID=52824 RepID=A0A8X7TSJ2_BRACI|nr:hypothetical protein Bca52824_082107 [Brassica carinata]
MALSGGFSTTTLSSGGRDGEPAEESSAFSLLDTAGVANMVESVVTSSAFSIREALKPTSTVGTSGGCGETSSEPLPTSSGAAQESPSTVVTIRGCGGASFDTACVETSIPRFDDQRLREDIDVSESNILSLEFNGINDNISFAESMAVWRRRGERRKEDESSGDPPAKATPAKSNGAAVFF